MRQEARLSDATVLDDRRRTSWSPPPYRQAEPRILEVAIVRRLTAISHTVRPRSPTGRPGRRAAWATHPDAHFPGAPHGPTGAKHGQKSQQREVGGAGEPVGCPPCEYSSSQQVGEKFNRYRQRNIGGVYIDANPTAPRRNGAIWRLHHA